MQNMQNILRSVAVAALLVPVTGCGSNVSKANFDKIKGGMTVAEVEAILGKPTKTEAASGTVGNLTGAGQVSTWTDGNKEITVIYGNGKVVSFTSKNL